MSKNSTLKNSEQFENDYKNSEYTLLKIKHYLLHCGKYWIWITFMSVLKSPTNLENRGNARKAQFNIQ